MKYLRQWPLFVVLPAIFSLSLQAEEKSLTPSTKEAVAPEVDIKKLSEAFGNFIGKNVQGSGLHFDIPSLIQGINNGSEGKPSPLSDQEYEKGMMALQEKAVKKLSEENLKAAEAFLKENKGKSGVVELEKDKLQYQIVKEGHGEPVKEHGSPSINYKGSFINGTVFGSSEESGGPITLPLDQTIPGFSKGIVGMKEGEKRILYVHPDVGYGTSGHLPPNSLLIFEVEVLKAEGKDKSPDSAFDEDLEDTDENEDTEALADNEVKNHPKFKKPSQKDINEDAEDEDEDD